MMDAAIKEDAALVNFNSLTNQLIYSELYPLNEVLFLECILRVLQIFENIFTMIDLINECYLSDTLLLNAFTDIIDHVIASSSTSPPSFTSSSSSPFLFYYNFIN